MEKERFRVSVCLQRYYCDERSRAYISVIPKYQVQWLQQRLRTLFALRGRFCLLSRGHLLPSEEPLSLLQPDDPIEVIPLSEESSQEVESKKKENEIQYSHPPENFKSSVLPEESNKIGPCAMASQEDEKDDALFKVKQQALELLDHFSGDSCVAEPQGVLAATSTDVPRRTRRRVRRRKRRTSTEESCNNGEESMEIKDRHTSEATFSTGDDRMIQNGAVGPRKARLVRSLSPSQS